MTTKIIESKKLKDTEKLAKMLLCEWLSLNEKKNSNWLLCLSGELGSGKTAFTKALAKELGVKGVVGSPTFVIMKKYVSKKHKKYSLYHFDCYRMSEDEEMLDLGFEEILHGENNIIIIEWPEKAEDVLPSNRLNIKFEVTGENSRRIEIS